MKRKIKFKPKKPQEFSEEPGLYWHVHHNILLEWCYNPRERAFYIATDKPIEEQNRRLARMRPVRNVPKWLRAITETHSPKAIHYELQELSLKHMEKLAQMHKEQCSMCRFKFTNTPKTFGGEYRLTKTVDRNYFPFGDLFP